MNSSGRPPSKASHTAEAVAAARYMASADPATGVRDYEASWYFGRLFRILSMPGINRVATSLYNRLVPGMIPFYVVRVHHYDRRIITALRKRGVKQICILGAGYDNRAFRLANELSEAQAQLYEVDRPETQDLKRRALRKNMAGQEPPHVRYVACDFLRDRLSEKLLEAGWRTDVPSFVIAEGVVYYLSVEGFDATLEALRSSCGEGSAFGFDYPVAAVVHGDREAHPDMVAAMNYAKRASNEIFTFDAIEAGEDSLQAFLRQRDLELCGFWDHSRMSSTYFRWLGPSIRRWGVLPTGFNIAEVSL